MIVSLRWAGQVKSALNEAARSARTWHIAGLLVLRASELLSAPHQVFVHFIFSMNGDGLSATT